MPATIGRRIREMRAMRKITQKQLADIVGISTSYMNLIESGKRPIAGTLLHKIAATLEVEPREIAQSVSKAQISAIENILSDESFSQIEIANFLNSMPKWGNVIAALGHELQNLKSQLSEVTDRLNQDSAFSATIHDLLSRIAIIRSTASILNTQGDLPVEKDSQFRNILHMEARQASDVARALIVHFEQTSKTISSEISILQNISRELYTARYDLPVLEDGLGVIASDDLAKWIETTFGQTAAQTPMVMQLFLTFARDIKSLPRDAFIAQASAADWDVEKIAESFDVPIDRVLRRIALVSAKVHLPDLALSIYDQAGYVWLAAPVSPSAGYAKLGCAIWPIFEAAHEPHWFAQKRIEMSDETKVIALAATGRPALASGARSPDLITSMVSFSHSPQVDLKAAKPLIFAGIDCHACFKNDCVSRRNRAILNS